jgi:neopullulanase
MLLISGDGLLEATVNTDSPDVKVSRIQNEATGHYLFVWLDTSRAHAGTVDLLLQAPTGSTTVRLPLQARSNHSAGFQGFGGDDVIYLIMPDRFADGDPSNDRPPGSKALYDRAQPKAYHGGDLRGIRERLGYLHELGVNTLWLTPIWKNDNSDYHGYHVVDFYATDDHMGSLQEYEKLVADAHKLGMKVLIDYVVNHTGPEHPWVKVPPSPSWFHGTPEKHLDAVYNFAPLTDPHATVSERRGTIDGWFVNMLPDLNTEDPVVNQYLLTNALWWTESTHLDGFRLDTFPYSSRRFWSQWLQELHQTYPTLNSIGEVSDRDVTITSFFDGGRAQFDGIDTHVSTIFDYPLYYALRDVLLRGQPVQRMIDIFRCDWLYAHPETLVTFIGNHDTSRFAGEPGSSKAKLEAAFSLLFTLRGIPQIYYGDEIGMRGGEDPDNRRDFPGGFPGDTRNGFTASGRTADEQEIFTHVQTLLKLRRAHPALRRGYQWHIAWDETYYAFVRESSEEKLLVVFNNAPSSRDVALKIDGSPLQGVRYLDKLFGPGQAQVKDDSLLVSIPAASLSMYRLK